MNIKNALVSEIVEDDGQWERFRESFDTEDDEEDDYEDEEEEEEVYLGIEEDPEDV